MAELGREVGRLRGYKERAEAAGDAQRRLEEKEADNDRLLEQVRESV